jgi:signal transduction histidine kinase
VLLSAADAEAQREEAIVRVHTQTLQLANLTALAENKTLETSEQVLAGLSWLVYLKPEEQDLCTNAVRQANAASLVFSGVAVVHPDGTLRCSSSPTPAGFSVASSTSFQRAVATGRFAVGDYRVNQLTGVPTVGLMLPVSNDTGALVGLLAGTVNLAWLGENLAEGVPDDDVLSLWDRHGVILARQPDHDAWVGKQYSDAEVAQRLQTLGGTIEAPGLDGIVRVWATVPVGEEPAAYLSVGAPLQAALAPIEAAFWRDLLVLGAVAALAFTLAWVASDRWVLGPLRALDAAARRIAAGDLGARTGLAPTQGEVGQVALAFDDMAASLEASLEREHRARQALEDANAQLAELDRFRRDFVNQAAHEINNPLTPIALQTELLRSGRPGPLSPQQQRALGVIDRNVARLARLAGDILDAARLQAGRLGVELERVDLRTLALEAVEAHREHAAAGQVTLDVAAPRGAEVMADPQRLAQVLDNLLSNALKFTPPGGRVLVEAGAPDGRASVTVRDTGAGFPPEDAARLFQPFSQLPSGKAHGGTGLGLYVSKGIVEQHGGTLRGASDGPGLGAAFTMELPLAPPAGAAPDEALPSTTAAAR